MDHGGCAIRNRDWLKKWGGGGLHLWLCLLFCKVCFICGCRTNIEIIYYEMIVKCQNIEIIMK